MGTRRALRFQHPHPHEPSRALRAQSAVPSLVTPAVQQARGDVMANGNFIDMHAGFLALRHDVYENYEAVVNAGRDAWNALMKLPVVILSIGNRAYAQVNIEGGW